MDWARSSTTLQVLPVMLALLLMYHVFLLWFQEVARGHSYKHYDSCKFSLVMLPLSMLLCNVEVLEFVLFLCFCCSSTLSTIYARLTEIVEIIHCKLSIFYNLLGHAHCMYALLEIILSKAQTKCNAMVNTPFELMSWLS